MAMAKPWQSGRLPDHIPELIHIDMEQPWFPIRKITSTWWMVSVFRIYVTGGQLLLVNISPILELCKVGPPRPSWFMTFVELWFVDLYSRYNMIQHDIAIVFITGLLYQTHNITVIFIVFMGFLTQTVYGTGPLGPTPNRTEVQLASLTTTRMWWLTVVLGDPGRHIVIAGDVLRGTVGQCWDHGEIMGISWASNDIYIYTCTTIYNYIYIYTYDTHIYIHILIYIYII